MNLDQATRIVAASRDTNDWSCPIGTSKGRWSGILRYFGLVVCEDCGRAMESKERAEVFCMSCLEKKFVRENAAYDNQPRKLKPMDWSQVPVSCGGSLIV